MKFAALLFFLLGWPPERREVIIVVNPTEFHSQVILSDWKHPGMKMVRADIEQHFKIRFEEYSAAKYSLTELPAFRIGRRSFETLPPESFCGAGCSLFALRYSLLDFAYEDLKNAWDIKVAAIYADFWSKQNIDDFDYAKEEAKLVFPPEPKRPEPFPFTEKVVGEHKKIKSAEEFYD